MNTRTIHGEQCRTIFFVGKPGSGKGTQAKILSETTGWRVISAGEQFRAIAEEDTLFGQKVKSEMSAGHLVPHWLVIYLYIRALFSLSDGESVIFDGFSRKVPEVEIVRDSHAWLGRVFTVFDIKISDEEVQKRLARRKEIEGRADDTVIDERLKEYYEYTGPAIEKFRDTGMLVEINGERPPEKIAADICEALGIPLKD